MSTAKTFRKGDRFSVRIERLSVGGRGVGRHEGLVVFVADTAPEETVEIELTFVKKNFAEARLLRVLEPSLHRVVPPCPVAGVCGGCSWQHVAYEEQLRQKRLLVHESLKKFASPSIAEGQIREVVPSSSPFRYRNRIQLHHSGSRIGYHRRGSHEIVDIDDCPITEEKLASLIPALRKELAHVKAGRVEILISTDGKIVKRKSGQSPNDEGMTSEVAGPDFSQVNTAQNINLVTYVVGLFRDALGGMEKLDLYDLYAGSGNFTFPLATAFPAARVIAAELNAEAVSLGKERAAKEFASNRIEFVQSDIERFLSSRDLSNRSFVLLDPPRTGCGPEVVRLLCMAAPDQIVYVSCHPVTLARDLKPLLEQSYQLESVQPFDMFPQTDHIETVVHLKR